MKPVLPLVLLLTVLAGCSFAERNAEKDKGDPGRLPSAGRAVTLPGLGPCNESKDRTLHLDPQQSVNVLVHGCNGSTGNFRALAEVLAFHGQQSACFTYDDRDSLRISSAQLAAAVDALARYLEQPRITVIGHSMGGLVARRALTDASRDWRIGRHMDLKLVTISAPFAGIASARFCAVPLLRFASLGLNDVACWLISGDKWYEITDASDFIRQPGPLAPQVHGHLNVATDERDSCRRRDGIGRCVVDDYVFSLAEQRYPLVTGLPGTTDIEVRAGHVEIVGEPGVIPYKLIAILQREGVVRTTSPELHGAFQDLLARLFGR